MENLFYVIKSFSNETEMKAFLNNIGFKGKIYTQDQIHKEV